jgi:hypothetical protein
MLYNFATASMSREDIKTRLDAVQEDALRILSTEGVEGFGAADAWRVKAASIVREAVLDTFRMTDPTPIFCERREGVLGDTYEFEQLINTLRVVEYSPQSEPQIFTPRKAKHTISTSSYELPFGIPLQKILNRQHTIGSFADMASAAMTRHQLNLVLKPVDVACGVAANDLKGRPLRTVAAGADVAKDEIDVALRRMLAFNAGVTIFGSRFALDPIYDHGAESAGDATKEELNRRGVIGTYRGARMVELVDDYNLFYQAWSSVNGLDYDKLIFLAAGVPGATLLEKDLSALNWEEVSQRAAQWATGTRSESGVLVHTPWRFHVIELV